MNLTCYDIDACVQKRLAELARFWPSSECVNCRKGAERQASYVPKPVASDGFRVCPHCGKTHSRRSSLCAECNKTDEDGTRVQCYCVRCGAKTKGDDLCYTCKRTKPCPGCGGDLWHTATLCRKCISSKHVLATTCPKCGGTKEHRSETCSACKWKNEKRRCPRCNGAISPSAKLCRDCNEKCPHCGARKLAFHRTCSKCYQKGVVK